MRPGPRLALVAVAVLTLAGGALRAHAATNPSAFQSADERAYAQLAHGIADHGVYRHPGLRGPVHWPPGAPALFAAGALLDPVAAQRDEIDVPGAYPLQAVIATALIPAVFVLALLVAGPLAGVGAAAAVALYPPLATSPSELLSEPLGALLLAGALIAVVLALRRPRARVWPFALAGLLFGATILTRADLLLVPLLAALVVGVAVARRASRRDGLRAAAALAAGCLLLAAPWSWYASRQAHAPTLVSSGGASNLFVGTYLPGDGRMFGLKRELVGEVRAANPELRGVRAANLPQTEVIGTVAARRPELSREAALRAEALENLDRYALGDPVAFAGMMASKVGRLWLGYTVGTQGNRRAWITAVHLALVLAGAAGLAAGLWRRRDPALILFAIIVLYVTVLNAVLVSEARHNLTVMPVLLVGGAAGWALVARPRARAW